MNRLEAFRAFLALSCVASLAAPVVAQRRPLYQAATTLLEALTAEQRQLASLPFESADATAGGSIRPSGSRAWACQCIG